jgi:hypothetical protein
VPHPLFFRELWNALLTIRPMIQIDRCTASWEEAVVDTGPVVAQLNFCGAAVVAVAAQACTVVHDADGGDQSSAATTNATLLRDIGVAIESTMLRLPDHGDVDPVDYARTALGGLCHDAATRSILGGITSPSDVRHAWQRVIALLASAVVADLSRGGLRVPVTRHSLPRLWPRSFLDLHSAELDLAAAIVTPQPKALLRRRGSDDALARHDVSEPSTVLESPRTVDIGAAHARKRRHLDTLIEETEASSTAFSDSLAQLIADGVV